MHHFTNTPATPPKQFKHAEAGKPQKVGKNLRNSLQNTKQSAFPVISLLQVLQILSKIRTIVESLAGKENRGKHHAACCLSNGKISVKGGKTQYQ